MHRNRRVAVGVEIGGGKATVALIDRQGRVLQRVHARTLRGRPAPATLDPYMRAIDTLLAAAREEGLYVCGLGVSIPGTLDASARRLQQVPLLPSLNGFPLGDLLEARYRLPTQLLVDVDAAVLGEHRFGAGKGYCRLLFLTVNAVVGASLVVNGRLEPLGNNYAGHVCHLPVAANGPRCSCGKHGCVNTLVSTDAMLRIVQRALRRGVETGLTRRLLNHEYFSLQLLVEEAERGDRVALQVYSEIGRWLGTAIAKYIHFCEPDVLVLGGGAFYTSDPLLFQIRNVLGSQGESTPLLQGVEILPARLGSDAVLVGTVIPLFDPPAASRTVIEACM
ncbi:MAG: ROK family protein [Ktedonobacteraceae bacterium]|nr:ROK family protein [Ktedonobacteraceae bacterium]